MSKEKQYLPIGTVLSLKNSDNMIFIAGYKVKYREKEYDYIGYTYPAGYLSNDEQILFNEDIINIIYYYGFKNSEYDKIVEDLGGKNNE